MPHQIETATRLQEVRYEIRGELARRALELEQQGRAIVKLNIGNPGLFGFETPAHLRAAIREHLPQSDPYCHQQGLAAAREAIAMREIARGAPNASPDSVFIGNGVSELIDLALRGLLNPGDEVLVPSPDYPLWTAAVILNGGYAVHYPCHPQNDFVPDIADIEVRITPRTRAIVVINPNNPTGAVYPRALLEQIADLAARHRLVVMADEIYDEILYDDAEFVAMATVATETVCLTFSGLSKVHRACGWRVGWMSLSGYLKRAQDYRHALDLLAALRLCSNVTAQWTIQPALFGPNTINTLIAPGGRLHDTRRAVVDACARSRFLTLVKPMGALYAFPGIDTALLPAFDDHRFALELLESEDVLLVPGSSFNVPYRTHFRLTLLPQAHLVDDVFARIERALERASQQAHLHMAVA
ncbi:MAG TPA: aminotransferase class I/II-fold pyridoxal phosphate-dependent enzyme [Pseudomonadota bacterium]|nr:aminotransferase class I/II-fold pyridoxal phosphate-dependent enzyme [Rhodanobacteraceae bacterium]MBP9155925.1 aminotransferase class I/II-fold pyridoxal phosphate-dependent enzyme [Xanthomonadales bacterium]HQW82581.1 aminotransferase class I/II-fold pyridoxal phosphate-dependent enzyme [Pseudomonadota bacterium]